MDFRKLIVLTFVLLHFGARSQSHSLEELFGTPPPETPDTLYLPYNEEGLQLVIINSYDNWLSRGVRYDMMYPRGGSWLLDHAPAPNNVYLWRNKNGEIIKAYNSGSTVEAINAEFTLRPILRSTEYINKTDFTHISSYVRDYNKFHQHLKFYGENGKQGLINLKGEIVIPAEFDEIRRFQNDQGSNDKILVQKDGKFGFLDANLNELFPPIYIAPNGYPEHDILNGTYIKVQKDKKYGLIDETGKVQIDFLYDDIRQIHDSMYIGLTFQDSAVSTKSHTNYWDWGYQTKSCNVFDKNFKVVTALKDYEYIMYWGIKQFVVKKGGQFGVINHLGEVVIPLEYDALFNDNGHYSVVKDKKRGLLSYEGKIVLPLEFEGFEIYGQAIYVVQNGLTGVYNMNGKLIAKPQFKTRHWDMGKYILTREDGSKGFVDHTEEFKLDPNNKTIYYQSPQGEKVEM